MTISSIFKSSRYTFETILDNYIRFKLRNYNFNQIADTKSLTFLLFPKLFCVAYKISCEILTVYSLKHFITLLWCVF